MKTIRFWHYGRGPVLIKMRAGDRLHHKQRWATDEGWSSESNVWSFDGAVLTSEWVTDGRDCDGRLTRHGSCMVTADKVKAGHRDEDGITYPDWQDLGGGQRDYSAEAMGY